MITARRADSQTSPGDLAVRARSEGALERLEHAEPWLQRVTHFLTTGEAHPLDKEPVGEAARRALEAEAVVRRLLSDAPAPEAEATLAAFGRAKDEAIAVAAARLTELGVPVPEDFVVRLEAGCASRDVLYGGRWYGRLALLLFFAPALVLLLGLPLWLHSGLSLRVGAGVLGAAAGGWGAWRLYRRTRVRIFVTQLGLHVGRQFWPASALWQAWSTSDGVTVLTRSHHQVEVMTRKSASLQRALQQLGVTLTTQALQRSPPRREP